MLFGLGKKKIGINLPAVNSKSLGNIMKVGKEDLQSLFKSLCEIAKSNNLDIERSVSLELSRTLQSLQNPRLFTSVHKEPLAKLYVSLTSDLINIYNLAQADDKAVNVWLEILQTDEISSDRIEKILGRKIKVSSPSYWSGGYFVEVLFAPFLVSRIISPFSSIHYRGENKYYFTLTPLPRKVLATVFLGKDILKPKILNALPLGEEFIVENFESCLIGDLSFLSGFAVTGGLKTSGGALTAAKIKTIKKSFYTKCFENDSSDYPLDRVELLANCYSVAESLRNDVKSSSSKFIKPDKFADFVLNKYPDLIKATRINPFLPAFKGFTKAWADENLIPALVSQISSLIKPAAEGWMSMENFKLRFLCLPVRAWTMDSYNGVFTSGAKQRHAVKRKNEDEYYRASNLDWFKEIDFPFVIHWIKFLCACGIIEIAYCSDEKGASKDEKDLLEGIQYIRLTPLGRYIYGFDSFYEVPEVEEEAGIEVDERTGILTLPSAESPYAVFLSLVAEKISSNRFRITASTMMKGCECKKEVEDRIENLLGLLSEHEAGKLNGILNDVRDRSICFRQVKDNYHLLRLRPEVDGLVDFILNNTEIRKNILLAEKSVVLVKKEFYSNMQKICRENGYML